MMGLPAIGWSAFEDQKVSEPRVANTGYSDCVALSMRKVIPGSPIIPGTAPMRWRW